MKEQQYYNYYNLDSYLNKLGIEMPEDYIRWFKDIIGTKITMFYYDDLPDELTSEIVEQALMFNNFLCFYNSPSLGLTLCRYRSGGVYGRYWKPVKVDLLTLTGQPMEYGVPYEDIVLVRDNPLDIIPFLTLNGWINKILDKEKTLDMEMRLARMPTMLVGDKEQAGMLKELMKKTYGYEGFAVGSKNFKQHVEQFDIHLLIDIVNLYDLIEKYKNLALNSMGIYGVDEKRERIVTSEVQANNDFTDFIYAGMLRERQRWVKEANAKWPDKCHITIHETYVDNQHDDIDIAKRTTLAKAQANIAIEQVKNEGKVEAAKITGLDASKVEANAMKEGAKDDGKPVR